MRRSKWRSGRKARRPQPRLARWRRAFRQARARSLSWSVNARISAIEWQALDARLTTALSAPPAQRDQEKEQVLRQRLTGIAARLDALDARFTKELPEYAALTNPQPLAIADAQKLLGPREALVLIASHSHQSLVWVIGNDGVRWMRVPLGEEELAREVAALRCGLDDTLWNIADSYDKCVAMLKKYRYDANFDGQLVQVLPFDMQRAHELYKALLGPVEDMIKDKQLLIAASGPLTSLPFNVLVTEPPKTRIPDKVAEYGEATWLGMRQPIAALPTVASLKALRQFAKTSRAKKTYLGIGNPLLEGPRTGQWRELLQRAGTGCARQELSQADKVRADGRRRPGPAIGGRHR